jgi:hypothetical protein
MAKVATIEQPVLFISGLVHVEQKAALGSQGGGEGGGVSVEIRRRRT